MSEPTPATLQAQSDMDTAEVRTCPICSTQVKAGDRRIRMYKVDAGTANERVVTDWVHYWHVE